MNLINQFPDVSMQTYLKFKARKKPHHWKVANPEVTFDENLARTKFYRSEFKKWHIKLIFIIGLAIAAVYFIASNIPALFM